MDQMNLFAEERPVSAPLASRLRPETLDEYVGQKHLVGPGKLLRRLIENDQISSMIFWGPPGVGKTTWPASSPSRRGRNSSSFPP